MAATVNATPTLLAPGTVNQPTIEALDLDPLVERLTARTTGAEAARSVRTVVEEVAHRFDNARVRTYLSVLISKQAEDQLRALGVIANASNIA
jgi:hypothetical protein